MEFARKSAAELSKWRAKTGRKPLILRGARQVGKTTLVKSFASQFKYSIILNLEKSTDRAYFTDFDDVHRLTDALFLRKETPKSALSQTLLFIDEIQESPEAISILRYFYEELPDLPVIAAGSLLEHAMRKVKSFPVGRVEYLYLFPLNFPEFLQAKNHLGALEKLTYLPWEDTAHPTLLELFHEYAIIGGMPEILSNYIQNGLISDLPPFYESLWNTYQDDIEKYASNTTEGKVIKHIFRAAPTHIDKRIKFENFGNSKYKSREVGEAFRQIDDARIVQLIYPTTELSPPIIPNLKKSPRLQFLDTGLLNFILNIQAGMLSLNDLNEAYRGAIIPHLICQEIISLNERTYVKPNFWVRDKNQSSSEVDLVIPFDGNLIPIEIKSGKQGTLRSLHQFIDLCDHHYAIRMYAGKFSIEQHTTALGKKAFLLMNLPYYLGTQIETYLSLFVRNY